MRSARCRPIARATPISAFRSSAIITKMFTMRRRPATTLNAPMTRNSSVASRPSWRALSRSSAFTGDATRLQRFSAMTRVAARVTAAESPTPSARPPTFEMRTRFTRPDSRNDDWASRRSMKTIARRSQFPFPSSLTTASTRRYTIVWFVVP